MPIIEACLECAKCSKAPVDAIQWYKLAIDTLQDKTEKFDPDFKVPFRVFVLLLMTQKQILERLANSYMESGQLDSANNLITLLINVQIPL